MTPEELIALFSQVPEPQPVFYRLYHDADGNPLFYSMTDMPGSYIEIDQATYARSSMRVKIVNSKLIEVTWKTVSKLVPGQTGTVCDSRNVAVVVNSGTTNTKWSRHTYESN
jgi:hypothetical protein